MFRIVWNLLFATALVGSQASAQITNLTIQAEADAFVRAASPDDNYGRAGNLSVAGTNSLNGFGEPGGRTESLVRFAAADLVTALDSFYENHDWFIAKAVIHAYEMASPNNAIFSEGAGFFAIQWLSNGDNWSEGTGSPNAPTTDGVTYNDLPALLNPPQDRELGTFTNALTDGFLDFQLALPSALTEDFRSGSTITLRFFPLDDEIGFTFLSRSDRRTELQMTLNLTISGGPPPQILSITNSQTNSVIIAFRHKANFTSRLQSSEFINSASAQWQTIFTATPNPTDQVLQAPDSISTVTKFYRLEAVAP